LPVTAAAAVTDSELVNLKLNLLELAAHWQLDSELRCDLLP
jgi:hypothetical protein